jgi:hypothetical protein
MVGKYSEKVYKGSVNMCVLEMTEKVSVGFKKIFWRKSAILGIIWGFISFSQFFAGGVMPFYSF